MEQVAKESATKETAGGDVAKYHFYLNSWHTVNNSIRPYLLGNRDVKKGRFKLRN